MPPLFPAWVDRVARAAIVAVVALLVLGPMFVMAWVRSPYVTGEGRPLEQPIWFDHRHHVADDGIDCLYCHTTAARGAAAGMPSTELCLSCHNQIWSDSPLLSRVWRSYLDREPIEWVRVTRLPDFVFFNHGIHVVSGVACETCHGPVSRMARIYQARPMTMGWCLECHRDPARHVEPPAGVTLARAARPPSQAATHCSACHR